MSATRRNGIRFDDAAAAKPQDYQDHDAAPRAICVIRRGMGFSEAVAAMVEAEQTGRRILIVTTSEYQRKAISKEERRRRDRERYRRKYAAKQGVKL